LFLAGVIPPNSPGFPLEVLFVVVPEALPGAGAAADANNEVVDFVFPNSETLGFGLLPSPNGDFVAGCVFPKKEPPIFVLLVSPSGGFVVVVVEGSFAAAVLSIELNSPLYGGFASAITPLCGLAADAPRAFQPAVPAVDPNNPPLEFVLAGAESEALVIVASDEGRPSHLNNPGSGFWVAGFGEGVLSF
jgi:hypothetical protein